MMRHKQTLMILALVVTVFMSMGNVQAANVSTLGHSDPFTSKLGRGISNFVFGFLMVNVRFGLENPDTNDLDEVSLRFLSISP